MTIPNGYFVGPDGFPLKSGILIAPDGTIQFVTLNSKGAQIISGPGGGAGTVSSVNNVAPDGAGNVSIASTNLTDWSTVNARLTADEAAIAIRAILNATQQTQQTAGATTALLSTDTTHLKSPAGTNDIPLGVSTVYQDSTGTTRVLSIDDMKGAASSYCTANTAYTIAKDLGVANGMPGANFYISGTGIVTFTVVSGVTIDDQRKTGATSYYTASINWVTANRYEVQGAKP